jgi:hypothetical protein
MTAARRERKSRVAIMAAVMFAVAASAAIGASTTEMVVVNRYTGLAIDGFDPVAYFVDAVPKQGRAEWELRSSGVVWRFQNEGNRQAFASDPAVYAPRFGGHDPMAVARGAATPGHPELWVVARQRLYLFYSTAARADFIRDPDSAIDAADRYWPQVQRELVRN